MCVAVAAVHEFVAIEAAGDDEYSQNLPQGRKLRNKSVDLRLAIWTFICITGTTYVPVDKDDDDDHDDL